MLAAAALAALLAADPVAPTVPTGSPVAEIITATCAGVAALIAATAGVVRMRRNRDAADAAPLEYVDPLDRPAALRERLSALEADMRNVKAALADVQEVQALHRAVDVVAEAATAPRRRRPRETS